MTDWAQRRRAQDSKFQAERYCSPKCTTPCGSGTREEKLSNFLELIVQLRKAPGFNAKPKMKKGSDLAATGRQIWYSRTGGHARGMNGPGLWKRCPRKQKSWLLVLSPEMPTSWGQYKPRAITLDLGHLNIISHSLCFQFIPGQICCMTFNNNNFLKSISGSLTERTP